MIIYGVALLSFCHLTGVYVGELIGIAIGVQANVGGVGIAMLLLMVLTNYCGDYVRIDQFTSEGITFWNAMYIPIVVAMAAQQNVLGAISGGPLAILAGMFAVGVGFILVPVMCRFGGTVLPAAATKAE